MTSAIDWDILRGVQDKLKPKESVKIIFEVNGTKKGISVCAKDLLNKIWELYDSGYNHIIVANKKNQILFKWDNQNVITNRIYNTSDTTQEVITGWKDLSVETRKSWLEILILEIGDDTNNT